MFVIKPMDLSCLSLNILAFCHVDIDVYIYSTCAFILFYCQAYFDVDNVQAASL